MSSQPWKTVSAKRHNCWVTLSYFSSSGSWQRHSPIHTFTFASRSRFRHKDNHLILCLEILMSVFSQLKWHTDTVLYLYEGISFQLPLEKSVFKPPIFTEFTYYFYQWGDWGTQMPLRRSKLRPWDDLIFCINLAGVRDAQMAGKTFSGCVCEGVSERLALDGIQCLSSQTEEERASSPCRWVSSNLLRVWIEEKEERWVCPLPRPGCLPLDISTPHSQALGLWWGLRSAPLVLISSGSV